uniref:tetratricopeptide repeat-containing sensor histidine kinase n=1 Tax=uncultured Draconibacterium sp. TaxID=1573823 RepID=UPI003216BE8C
MQKRILMKAVFYVVLICILAIASRSYGNISHCLSDSLSNAINTHTIPNEFDQILGFIRKHKDELGNHYIPLLKQYSQKARHNAYARGEMKSYDFIGLEYRYQENYDTAYFYHTKSLEMAIRLKDSTQIFYNYNNLGQVFRMQDINTLAIDYFHKALEVSNAVGNLRSSSYTMNTIGATLVVQRDYERAMKYFQMSSEIARKRNDKRTLAYNFGNMGEVFLLKNQPDSAMYYFQLSLDWLVELNSDKGMGVAEHLIGQAYFGLKEYDKAKEKFDLALVYHKKDNNQRYQSLCNCYLGKIATAQHKYDSAMEYLGLAKTQAIEINSLKNMVEAYDGFAELYKQQNHWEKAYEAKLQSFNYSEKILNEKNNSSIHALEIGFETKEKEQKIVLLSAENKLKNQRLRVGVILLSVLIVIIILILYILQIRRKQAKLVQTDLQQQVLRSQMNPHFIYNVLGSIQNYMLSNDSKKAAGYLSQFAALTRSTLEYSSEERISLSDEIKMLRNYMELEQMRKPGLFEFQIEHEEELESDFILVPPMMIQPFVENAIKHGFKNIDYIGKLVLSINDKQESVEVVIQDNGVGVDINNKRNELHRSMAMEIFEKRRKLIQHRYKKDFTFNFSNLKSLNSELSGVKVTLEIPVLDND